MAGKASGPNRRELFRAAAILPIALKKGADPLRGSDPKPSRPVVIASSNEKKPGEFGGVAAVKKAREILTAGGDPVEAVVSGVNIVENDPDDVSVGYGGIPNEEGIVQLDASVMDGRTMKAGAVGALEGCKTPSRVARLVMERTSRVFLVGEGARRFATAHGFAEEDLLTERSRKIWLFWKERLSKRDDWRDAAGEIDDPDIKWYIERYGDEDFRQGTINCNAVTAAGELAGVTTTSGLFFKIPGRLGDSPVIGAGLYVDGEVGACGSTGWGEGNLRACGSHTVVEFMRQGKSPEEAALKTLERMVAMAKDRREDDGRPDFNVNFYAVNKKGQYGGAAVWNGPKTGRWAPSRFAVADAKGSRVEESAYLYRRSPRS